MDASLTSQERFGLLPAPDGLRLVQDLVNTKSVTVTSRSRGDLLDDVDTARTWLAQALAAWAVNTSQVAPELTVDHQQLGSLRRLRDSVCHVLMRGDEDGLHSAHADLRLALHGNAVAYGPSRDEADGLAALVFAELLLAARTGQLARMKICANHHCAAAFFDKSRNTSRVWHDVKTCGNTANLRASRNRKRNQP